ncbi:MAG: hypothetical protein O3B24_11175 [Verrucomicrobia bacterium]|nr:hypothetical protein [Verrucomicrobiota bacterium]
MIIGPRRGPTPEITNNRTVTIIVPAAKDSVFNFLASIENLPVWATEFCEGIKQDGNHYKVITSTGELFFRIESDRKTGVVDMFVGPMLDQMGIFPCRVIAMPTGPTAVSFTFFQAPDMPGEVYDQQFKSLLVELDGLKRRFGSK